MWYQVDSVTGGLKIESAITAAFNYSYHSETPCTNLINWLENMVFKDIVFVLSVEEIKIVREVVLKVFYNRFETWSIKDGFLNLINYIIEINLRWAVLLEHECINCWKKTLDKEFTLCEACFYQRYSMFKIENFTRENGFVKGALFYY